MTEATIAPGVVWDGDALGGVVYGVLVMWDRVQGWQCEICRPDGQPGCEHADRLTRHLDHRTIIRLLPSRVDDKVVSLATDGRPKSKEALAREQAERDSARRARMVAGDRLRIEREAARSTHLPDTSVVTVRRVEGWSPPPRKPRTRAQDRGPKDRTGDKLGDLTVLSAGPDTVIGDSHQKTWWARCEAPTTGGICGSIIVVRSSELNRRRSCGCRTKRGRRDQSAEYQRWESRSLTSNSARSEILVVSGRSRRLPGFS